MTAAALASVERSRSGVAAGTLTSMRQTGSLLGVALFGSLVAGRHFVAGLHEALVVSLAALALSALISPR
jgi:MFS transporter, DHA2 family, methylenomycin A resistance protein